MAKKKKKATDEQVEDTKKDVSVQEEEDYGQFGGFPDRDLKRNLGCG